MAPTVNVGDRVLAERLSFLVGGPQRGDIILFQDPNDPTPPQNVVEDWLTGGLLLVTAHVPEQSFIKRVVGLAGDRVEIRDGRVFIDGEAFDEPPGVRSDHSTYGPVTVEAGHVFVLGDNRANSSDSRSLLGQIPEGKIIARVFMVL
jgi:signal peptidase I